jgi:Lhr-like helicase
MILLTRLVRHFPFPFDLGKVPVWDFIAETVIRITKNRDFEKITDHKHWYCVSSVRTVAIRNFKEGKLRVMVATDLAARGIDIQYLPFVVNYELPRSPKDYIHRIGRTGRAGSEEEAISLISEADEHHFKVIQKKMKRVVELIDSKQLDF